MWRADALLETMPPTDIDCWSRLLDLPVGQTLEGRLASFSRRFGDPLAETYRVYHGVTDSGPGLGLVSQIHEQTSGLLEYAAELGSEIEDGNFSRFKSGLEHLSSHFLGRPSTLRDHPIYLAPDVHGRYGEFPDHGVLEPQLQRLFHVLCDDRLASIYRASVAYVVICGAHPFADGNGRVARLLFNALLVHGGMPVHSYVPFKAIHWMSNGGLSLRLRRALQHGTWEGVMESHTHMIFLTYQVNSEGMQGR